MKKLYTLFFFCLFAELALYWFSPKITASGEVSRYLSRALWLAVFVLGVANVWFALFKVRIEARPDLAGFGSFVSVCKLLTYVWLGFALYLVAVNVFAVLAVGAVFSFFLSAVCILSPPLWILLPFVVPTVFAFLTPLLLQYVLLWGGAIFVAYAVQFVYSAKTVWRGFKLGVFTPFKAIIYCVLQFFVIIDIFTMFSIRNRLIENK